MSLDALAPDQRAVVQLVLQQDRSYEDLAALLGITPDAVRERAHRGLERLAPAGDVDAGLRAEIADYLLGQQSVSGRESTRTLLHDSEPGRVWALAVAAELAGVARSSLPEVPAGAAAATAPDPAPELEPDPEPLSTFETSVLVDPAVAEEPATPTPSRARPRPRREPTPAPDFGFDSEPEPVRDEEPDAAGVNRTSRLGGALLIAGLGIFVAVLIVWLVTRSDDDTGTKAAGTSTTDTPAETATPAASATGAPDFQAIGKLNLKSATGGTAKGSLIVFAAQSGEVAFNVKATKVPPTAEGQAYGVWLVGEKDHFLGFAPPVGNDGKLAVSGPRESDQANFAKWLSSSKQVVVSTETQEGASSPGPLVLQGDVAKATAAAGAATATPTP